MKNFKFYKLLFGLSPIALTSPAFAISCSCVNYNYQNNKPLLLKFDEFNKSAIYIPSFKFSNIDELEVFDQTNDEKVEINYESSKIENNNAFIELIDYEIKEENNLIVKNKITDRIEYSVSENKTLNSFNLNEDKQYFFNLIKDISSNKIPIIIDTRNASLVLQQSFYISLVNYFQNKNIENINEDLSILITDNASWEENRFNAEILLENDIWNGIKDLDKFDSSNIKRFNIINESRLSWSTKDYLWQFNQIIEKFNIDSKFDFVIPDLNFIDLISEFEKNNNYNKLAFILKRANRIIVTSDGSAHTDKVVPFLTERLQNLEVKDREYVIQRLKDFQEGNIDKLSNEDIYNLLLLKNFGANDYNQNSDFHFINFVHYDANINNTLRIDDQNMWNLSTFSTNFVEYGDIIENEVNKEEYLETYSKLFLEKEIKTENVIISGLESWDKNKKNAIFLGSSLFTPLWGDMSPKNYSRLEDFPILRGEVQKTFDIFLQKFNPEEYNIMFKLHPVFSSSNDPNNLIAKKYVNLISNGKIENPIIISPKIPIETLISNDYYLYTKRTNDSSETTYELDNIIFRSNEKYKAYEWTTFFGFQATSTTIHTTRLFYQDAFDLTTKEVADLIPFSNFPIPSSFSIVDRAISDIQSWFNQYNDNLQRINHVFQLYCPSINFKN